MSQPLEYQDGHQKMMLKKYCQALQLYSSNLQQLKDKISNLTFKEKKKTESAFRILGRLRLKNFTKMNTSFRSSC